MRILTLVGLLALTSAFTVRTGTFSRAVIKQTLRPQRWKTDLNGLHTVLEHVHTGGSSKVVEDPLTHLATDLLKLLQRFLQKSESPTVMAAVSTWRLLPKFWKNVLTGMAFGDLFLFILFKLSYRRAARMAHQLQIFSWKWLAFGKPYEFKKSILGFAEERGALLARIMGGNYLIKMLVRSLQKLGFRIDAGLPILMSKIAYTLYAINFIDLFKSQFLHTFFPNLAENRRQSYVVNRSTSVIIWVIGVLAACEMVSTYFKVPLSSTLAFGGVGGIALGLSARDIAANFLGGMLLLFNEPFTPGDMVTFRSGSTELVGRVERVGWGQTRIRGRDTRPTYVPNSHFVQAAVTNMERITHRKFEATIPLRFQDHIVMPEILAKVKEALRALPKLDVLSMPFRVSFVKFGAYALEIEITCYFATKSIDEFLALQQMANLEVVRIIRDCGAQLALPTTLIHMPNAASMDSAQAFLAQIPVPPMVQSSMTATTQVTQVSTTSTSTSSVVVPTTTIPQPKPQSSSSGLDSLPSSASQPPALPKTQLTIPVPITPVSASSLPAALAKKNAAAAAVLSTTISRLDTSPAQPAPLATLQQQPTWSPPEPPSKSAKPIDAAPSTAAALSPAAKAILAEAQAGSFISEAYAGRVATAPPSSVKDGGPTKQASSSQTDPRKKVIPELPQQPLPPTASTPPASVSTPPPSTPPSTVVSVSSSPASSITLQSLNEEYQQQQQQQQKLLDMQKDNKGRSARQNQAPVFTQDGSISWSWLQMEESIAENGEEDSGGGGFVGPSNF